MVEGIAATQLHTSNPHPANSIPPYPLVCTHSVNSQMMYRVNRHLILTSA